VRADLASIRRALESSKEIGPISEDDAELLRVLRRSAKGVMELYAPRGSDALRTLAAPREVGALFGTAVAQRRIMEAVGRPGGIAPVIESLAKQRRMVDLVGRPTGMAAMMESFAKHRRTIEHLGKPPEIMKFAQGIVDSQLLLQQSLERALKPVTLDWVRTAGSSLSPSAHGVLGQAIAGTDTLRRLSVGRPQIEAAMNLGAFTDLASLAEDPLVAAVVADTAARARAQAVRTERVIRSLKYREEAEEVTRSWIDDAAAEVHPEVLSSDPANLEVEVRRIVTHTAPEWSVGASGAGAPMALMFVDAIASEWINGAIDAVPGSGEPRVAILVLALLIYDTLKRRGRRH